MITQFGISLLEKVFKLTNVKTVLELGSQNLLDGRYASEFYKSKNIQYNCIDLNGENNAIVHDLSKPYPSNLRYDLVTDFGTGEHVSNITQVLKTIHDSVKVGGYVIRENPKEGNWMNDVYHKNINYMTQHFYTVLCKRNNYEIIELGDHAAMGNNIDGWEIYCIYKKIKDAPFK